MWPNVLSLDAPIVAILWQALFAATVNNSLHAVSCIALGVTVWLIYAADRIFDGLHGNPGSESRRHQFHRFYRSTFVTVAAASLLLLAFLARLLDTQIFRYGSVLAAVVGTYMLIVHRVPGLGRTLFPKEMLVGTLFAAGTCLAPWSLAPPSAAFNVAALLFAALCCLNCSAIEFWEWNQRGRSSQAQPHVVTIWIGANIALLSLVLAMLSALCLLTIELHLLFGALMISSLAFCWLAAKRDRLSPDALRVLADVPLLSPVLFAVHLLVETRF